MITPTEYLAMRFPEREPEYVRGELRYRPWPDRIHGRLQAWLSSILIAALRPKGFSVETEVRCKLEDRVYRLPDIAVFGPESHDEEIPDQPPFIACEIVSKDESHSELLEKLEDYRTWGVPHIWVIDPRRKKLSIFDDVGLRAVEYLHLPEQNFRVTLAELLES